MRRKRVVIPIVALAVTLMAGCTIGPDYQAPEITAPPQFVSQEVLKLLNESNKARPFAVDWWKGFDDPVLDRLMEHGLASNFEIAAASAGVVEARAAVRLAGAGDNLTVAATADGSLDRREVLSGNGGDTTTEQVFGSLGAGLPLDVFGRVRREVMAARAAYDGARETLKSVVLAVSADIVREYLRLRGNQRQLALLQESVSLQEQTLAIVTSRYRAGLSPELDVRRAETSVENLRANIPRLKQSLLNGRNRLAVLAGQFSGAFEDLLAEERDIPVYKARIPDLMPLEVLNMRPDVRRAEAALKQAIAEIGVAEALYYPAFQLTSQISIGATNVSGEPTTNVLIASLAALIDQVVTDGGARKANLELVEARASRALAEYELALRRAGEEVEISLAAINASIRRQESLEKAVVSSERSFYQAETLHNQGLISFLDVVDAQRVFAAAEQELAAERTDYATEIANLFRVLGVEVDRGV